MPSGQGTPSSTHEEVARVGEFAGGVKVDVTDGLNTRAREPGRRQQRTQHVRAHARGESQTVAEREAARRIRISKRERKGRCRPERRPRRWRCCRMGRRLAVGGRGGWPTRPPRDASHGQRRPMKRKAGAAQHECRRPAAHRARGRATASTAGPGHGRGEPTGTRIATPVLA